MHLLRHPLPAAGGRALLSLLVGVGNAWRGDDGAGPAVASRVRGLTAEIDVRTLEGDVSALLDLWTGHEDVVVVDAACSGAAPPGTLHVLGTHGGPLPPDSLRSSTHAFGLVETVRLASALGRLPAHLEILAIEGEDFSLGAGLSPAVATTAEQLAMRLARRGAAPRGAGRATHAGA